MKMRDVPSTVSSIVASIIVIVVVLATFVLAAAPAAGQAATAKTIPRLADGKPDFNGIWDRPRVNDISRDVDGCGSGARHQRVQTKGLPEIFLIQPGERTRRGRDSIMHGALPTVGIHEAMGTAYPVEIIKRPNGSPTSSNPIMSFM
jgi:hypothetical protein